MTITNILSNFWLFLKNPLDEPKKIKNPIALTLKLCVINTILAISSALIDFWVNPYKKSRRYHTYRNNIQPDNYDATDFHGFIFGLHKT